MEVSDSSLSCLVWKNLGQPHTTMLCVIGDPYTLYILIYRSLLPCLLEIDLVVLEKEMFKSHQCTCIFAIALSSPLDKVRGSSFVQFESTLPKDSWCQVWLKLVQWFWEDDENVENLQTDNRCTDGQTNDRKHAIRSSGKQKINHNVLQQYISTADFFYFLHNRSGEPWQPSVKHNFKIM